MAAAAPQQSLWQKVEQVFRDAPVLNPDGSRGVNVIIDHGQGGLFTQGGQALADADCLTLTAPPASAPGCATIANFFSYKATNFSADRLAIFHYAIFGKKGLDGQTDASGSGERFGNDFFVTLASLFSLGNDPDVQTGHFVHELGHNLGFSARGPDVERPELLLQAEPAVGDELHVYRRRGGSRLRPGSGRRLHLQPGHAGAARRIVRRRDDRHLRQQCRST
jgi:hypothetical protein